MKYKNILFDFDGTLANTVRGILITMQETFREMGVAAPSEDAMTQTIGLPLRDALQTLGQLDEAQADEAAAIYRRLFPIYEVGNVTVFPGVIETLQELHQLGTRMAIVTSRDLPSLNLIMEPRGLMPYFEERLTGSDHITPKPAPDMVLTLLDRMQLRPEETLVVGDTTYDILMGNRAGCPSVAVTYGNHSRQQLLTASPTHVIDDIKEILQL